MEIIIPNTIIQMAIDAHHLQLCGISGTTVDDKYKDIERIQYHVGEIVCALIIKEYIGKKQ